jgi:hypothetical protein
MDLNKMVIINNLKIHKNLLKMLLKISYNIKLYPEKILPRMIFYIIKC